MQPLTVLLLLLAILVALGVVGFQYFYKSKKTSQSVFLASLRFIAIFAALLLLINPKFPKTEYTVENANLILLADNSSSITKLNGDRQLNSITDSVITNQQLGEKFDVKHFAFGEALKEPDSLGFTAKRTNISRSLKTLNESFTNTENLIVLLTDGNQTVGEDFEFLRFGNNTAIFPIVIGDTTKYRDISIGQINVNRYAFLGNTFPVEAEVVYFGNAPATLDFQLLLEGRTVYREALKFSENEGAKTVRTALEATSTGIKSLEFRVTPLENERNTENNQKNRFIEVIDEKTTVAIVSAMRHPDIGTLKEAIETNEQRNVVLLDTGSLTERLEEIDIFILYQPDRSFSPVYDFIAQRGGGVFTITGPETDWNFLETEVPSIQKEAIAQEEVIFPVKNEAFNLFESADFTMLDYPPLSGELGEVEILGQPKVIAYKNIKGVTLNEPLFFVLEEDNKQAFLLGADIWKWRLQSYRNSGSFETFDTLIGKLFLFLSDSGKKERLRLDYENRYDNASRARITASFFDKTYVFDPNASLSLQIVGVNTDFEREEPMLLQENQFESDLGDLEPGQYEFTVRETTSGITRSGSFSILDFDLEGQASAANYGKLDRLAQTNRGQLYYPDQTGQMILNLLEDARFVPVQKSNKNVVSLIDFRWLLAVMALALALEWIIRKYNGLL